MLVSRHGPSPAHPNNSDAVKKVLTAHSDQTAPPLAASDDVTWAVGTRGLEAASLANDAQVTLTGHGSDGLVTSAAFSAAHYCPDM